jgi:hypothetical protein
VTGGRTVLAFTQENPTGHDAGEGPIPTESLSRLAERVLHQSPYGALKGVACDESAGVVRLGGQVPSQYLKQVAFALVSEALGACPVANEIRVVTLPSREPGESANSTGSGWYRTGPRAPQPAAPSPVASRPSAAVDETRGDTVPRG